MSAQSVVKTRLEAVDVGREYRWDRRYLVTALSLGFAWYAFLFVLGIGRFETGA
jgi:hypothetical protein